MGEISGHFNESEMRSFGYDPDVKEDRNIWIQTEPAPQEAGSVYNYDQDIEAFGSETTAELKLPARGYLGQVRGH